MCSRGDEAARLHDSNKENRHMKLVLTSALAMILLSTIPAEAQLCAGAPSFRDNPLQVGASAAFRGGAQGVGGSFAAGGESLFAAAGVSVLNVDDVDSSATTVSGTIGVDLQADDNGRVFLCPIGQVAFTAGPDFGPVDVSTITLTGGVSLGVIASQSDALTVIPTFGLFAVHSRDGGSRRFGQHRIRRIGVGERRRRAALQFERHSHPGGAGPVFGRQR